jgi:hypothetical protein
MVTFSSAYDWSVFLTIDSLLLFTLSILFRRKLYRRLFFFTTYLVISMITDVAWRWTSLTTAYYLRMAFYYYWTVEFLLTILRLLAFAEVSRRILRVYPTVFAAGSWILTAAAAILLSWTAYPAVHSVRHIWPRIVVANQRIGLMQAVLVLALLTIGAYYRIQIPSLYRLILVGIGVFASIQVVNNELLLRQSIVPYSVPDYMNRASMVVSTIIWTYAVWRWCGAPESQPELISQVQYEKLSPQIHDKMRDLNDKLAKLFGKA